MFRYYRDTFTVGKKEKRAQITAVREELQSLPLCHFETLKAVIIHCEKCAIFILGPAKFIECLFL